MEAKKIIRQLIRECIEKAFENVQMADKAYFKAEKLSQNAKDIIISKITNGDNYTKLISDIYYAYLQTTEYRHEVMHGDVFNAEIIKELQQIHQELKNYSNNVFPIDGLDIFNSERPFEIALALKERQLILNNFKKLPSIAWRNMKSDIKVKRDYIELGNYNRLLEYFLNYYSLLDNRNKELRKKIIQKMFKSETTIDKLTDFVEEKENLLGGKEFTKEQIKEMSETEDFEIIYDTGDVMIAKVQSQDGIRAIGCNSLWCFTYGQGQDRMWSKYSYNGVVYVIIDFKVPSDDSEFMHVLIRPFPTDDEGNFEEFDEDHEDDSPLFDMSNVNYHNPYLVLKDIFGDNYKKIVEDYMDFDY